ncbi:hypothetical protein GCM10027091_49380 [Streptomyces daliensis]
MKKLLTNRTMLGVFVGQYFINTITWFFLTWFPVYLVQERGMSILEAGFVASLPALCGFAGGVLGGFLSDWLNRRGMTLPRGGDSADRRLGADRASRHPLARRRQRLVHGPGPGRDAQRVRDVVELTEQLRRGRPGSGPGPEGLVTGDKVAQDGGVCQQHRSVLLGEGGCGHG